MVSSTPSQQSPTREAPNPHPYAIKTTSTGLLTRSNSSKAHGSWARHRYTPAPPSPSAFVFDPPESSPSPSRRHTKSASDAPSVHASPSDKSRRPESPRGSEMSYSPSPSKFSKSWLGKNSEGEQVKLPRHPYLWTPAHLATYLSSELYNSEGDPLDSEVVQSMVHFVQEQKIGGRAFLSLDQEDFQEMEGVDETWCNAFWDASCTLRKETHRPSRVSNSSYKRGRVRGIVGVFERSASESSDVGEDDAPNQSLSEVVLPSRLAKGKLNRQSRNRGWSVSESEEESTKSDWERAQHSRSRRDSETSGVVETPVESEFPKSPIQPSASSTSDVPTVIPGVSLVPQGHSDDLFAIDAEGGATVVIRSPLETPQQPLTPPMEPQDLTSGSPGPDLPNDNTPNNREVEIISVHGHQGSEPSMAELYEQTYGEPAPVPSRASQDEHTFTPGGAELNSDENPAGETVKIVSAAFPAIGHSPPAMRPKARRPKASRAKSPSNLTHLFVPSPVPEQVGNVESQTVYVLPARDPEPDAAALRTLDTLKQRLEVVERRLEAMEEKDAETERPGSAQVLRLPLKSNLDAVGEPLYRPDPELTRSWRNDVMEKHGATLRSRQSAYILLAGAASGISMVLVPLVLRHWWTR